MQAELLIDLARHQRWADREHWRVLREHAAALDDGEICKRLNHMVSACQMLQTLARGETPDFASMKDRESADDLQAAMERENQSLIDALPGADLDRMIALPRGPKGPFEAPAGVLLLQAITHGQHHRGQNASRMRALGVTPPMTDFVIWHALGRP
ncbi:MAG TPA: DinB family protein [Candidatus Acidoferrales bacterium]|nr:DinB family protein [Candidatus Acidoferrales bacterium]